MNAQRRAETTISQRSADRKDFNNILFSQQAKREPLSGIDCYGEQETSAGLSHAQRVMRKIRLVHATQDELESWSRY